MVEIKYIKSKTKRKKLQRDISFIFEDVNDNLYYGLKITSCAYKIAMDELVKIILTLYVDEGVVDNNNINKLLKSVKTDKTKNRCISSNK